MRYEELERLVVEHGWQFERQNGSHRIFSHPNRDTIISIPAHCGKDLPKGLVNAILKQAGLK